MLIRGHHQFDGQFTQVPNGWLRDPNLSLGAKGLLAQLLSHSPGWQITVQGIAKQNGCGKDKVRSLIRELEAAGYLARSAQQRHNERGHLAGYDYTTCDPPLADYPTKAEPTKAEPTKEKSAHKNTIGKNTIDKKTIDIESSSFEQQYLADVTQQAFEDFWKIYPNRLGKGEARKAFVKAVEKVGLSKILEGAQRLADDPNLPEKRYIPRPGTWLNQERWDDDPYPPRGIKKAETKRLIDEWARTEES